MASPPTPSPAFESFLCGQQTTAEKTYRYFLDQAAINQPVDQSQIFGAASDRPAYGPALQQRRTVSKTTQVCFLSKKVFTRDDKAVRNKPYRYDTLIQPQEIAGDSSTVVPTAGYRHKTALASQLQLCYQ